MYNFAREVPGKCYHYQVKCQHNPKAWKKRDRSGDPINAAQEVGRSHKYRGVVQEKEYFEGKIFTRNLSSLF